MHGPDLTLRQRTELARRFGVSADSIVPWPSAGLVNNLYTLGESLILRVPVPDAGSVASARTEALVVPLVRQAGVSTPALVAFDDTAQLFPVPFAVYERVQGTNLGLLEMQPGVGTALLLALGRDLALLHQCPVEESGLRSSLQHIDDADAGADLEALASAGYLGTDAVRWLSRWLDRLAPPVDAPRSLCLLHGDVHPANVMVATDSMNYLALLDWGDAGLGDPAMDFEFIPLRWVPAVLEGYRELTGERTGLASEERILWYHLKRAIAKLGRPPRARAQGWMAQPLNRLVDITRFFVESPPEPWRSLAPPG